MAQRKATVNPGTARTLVFCGTRQAIERFDMLPGWRVIVASYPAEQKAAMIREFLDTPGAKLAVDRSMIYGWRAPADTLLLFDPSWPYSPAAPESVQAVARRATPYMERNGR